MCACSLASAWELATQEVKKVKDKYKKYQVHDRGTQQLSYRIGDWILIRFPAEETESNGNCLSHGTDLIGS